MSAIKEINNSKENLLKLKAPLYFSPYSYKKYNLGIIHTEPKNIYQETNSYLSKNQIKQKINNGNNNKNIINIQQPYTLKKNTKFLSKFNDINNPNIKNPQSQKKSNSKLYLKKNLIGNISIIDDKGINILKAQQNTRSNTNINNISNDKNNKNLNNKINNFNIQFNNEKSYEKFLNSNYSANNLKKNAGSAFNLLDNNNNLKKSKTKNNNIIEINNLNPISYIYTSENNQKQLLSKNEKIKNFEQNKNKGSKKNIISGNESNNKDGENENNQINCVLRNTFNNVKIYPTTVLNNKIILNQVDKDIQNKNKNEDNNNNNANNQTNNPKIKKEKIFIDINDKKDTHKNEKFESIEELHYFYIDILQKGKIYAIKLDK